MTIVTTMWRGVIVLLLSPAASLVDEAGRYRAGSDLSSLVPPEPTAEDRAASIDLSKQPVEKLFRLLAFELLREEKRPPERRLGIRDFQDLTELSCQDRLVRMVEDTNQVSEEIRLYHLNVTGTSGLFWLLHKYPDEHSWVWLIAVAHDRASRKVEQHLTRLSVLAIDDGADCLSPGFRTSLMNAAVTWKRIHGDHSALVWNGVAFGMLGDVTSWRDVGEDGETVEDGPGGPPPNVSWSENLIFGNMWLSSVQKWLEHHVQEITQGAYGEIQRAQAGLSHDKRWRTSGDGVISSFEYLRRQLWGTWELDKGLLRGMLRHCLEPGYGDSASISVGDFGAGGGRYSEWLNDTGLVEAFAIDAVQGVQDITGGSVSEVNLASDVNLWRTFDWVLSLDVGAYFPISHAQAFLSNIRRHAKHGLVISWPIGASVAGQAIQCPLTEDEFVSLVERETGFRRDAKTTAQLRTSCDLRQMSESVMVFRAPS